MASARLLGVIFLPGEAGSEEHGLRPSFFSEGVSLPEQWRSIILVASSYILKEEGREVTVASPFSSGEKRSTPPLPLYNWWRTSHLTFSLLRREEHDPPPSSSWEGISSWGVEGCDHCQSLWFRKREDWPWHLPASLGPSYFQMKQGVKNMAFTRPFSKGGSLLEQWRSAILVASPYIQREEGREVTAASPLSSGEKRSTPPLPL